MVTSHGCRFVQVVHVRIVTMRTYENTKNLLVTMRNGRGHRTRDIERLVDIFERLNRKGKRD
jgi:hypothetical protein